MNWGYTILWIVLMVVFLVVEASCPIHLVSIWFAAGSLVAAIAAALGGQRWLQILLFLVISCGLLAALWPFVKKVLNPKRSATNIDAVIGSEGYVTVAVDNLNAVFDCTVMAQHGVGPQAETCKIGGDAGHLESHSLKRGVAPRLII